MQKEATPSLKLCTIDRPRQHGYCLIVIYNASTNAALWHSTRAWVSDSKRVGITMKRSLLTGQAE